MPTPEISVIINTYNYGAYVTRAIDSALAQSGPHSEVIVVDDGSTDDTRQVLHAYGNRIRALFQPNRGQAAAMNAGVAASRAPLLAFLDADDWWLPGKLAAVTRAFAASPRAGLAYHRLQPMLSDGTPVMKPIPRSLCQGDLAPRMLRSGGVWPFPMTSALAVRRAAWDHAGPIPERFRISADAWLVGIQPFLGPVAARPEALGCYRIHDNTWHRAKDDAAMLIRRMAHWRAVVEETNAFLDHQRHAERLALTDHWAYRLAAAQLLGATVGKRIQLLAVGFTDPSEPSLPRRLRNVARAVWRLQAVPMAGVAGQSQMTEPSRGPE